MSAPLPEDRKAGFTGLIVGVVFLLCVGYTIVTLTNHHYAAHEAPSATATQ